jgi:hypothetical protein
VSTDPAAQEGETAAASAAPGEPTEDELRAAYEAELSRITPAEVMLQSAVSLLNIGARRLGLTGGADPSGAPGGAQGGAERDLEQVRDAIDGVRALLGILERSAPAELRPLRDALSQLQIAFARETQGGGTAPAPAPQAPADPGANAAPDAEETGGPGPAQSSGRLWVPGS